MCRKELGGWEEGDDPMSEHGRIRGTAKQCPFVMLVKKQKGKKLQVKHDKAFQCDSFNCLANIGAHLCNWWNIYETRIRMNSRIISSPLKPGFMCHLLPTATCSMAC